MLLYDREVMEQEMITLPHPRLTFRRFVLQPAAEVAPKMLHPVIGWSIERLLLHLDAASDVVAIVSPSETRRRALAEMLAGKFAAAQIERTTGIRRGRSALAVRVDDVDCNHSARR